MDGYAAQDAVGLAALVRSGEVKPAELLEAARTRSAEVNPRLNAIVLDVDPAHAVEGPAVNGDAPFSGVPFLIKDLGQDLAGYPTSGGSRSLAAVPVTENATVVQRWLDAGLVVFGRTNTSEFGAKGIPEPSSSVPRATRGTPSTPRAAPPKARAAAVAAGIVPCAGATAVARSGSRRRPAGCSASRHPAG
jgi:Asp-tRNA(Asn)/Glu-tRNA(Gln) amidotransferase A subunit family amidase